MEQQSLGTDDKSPEMGNQFRGMGSEFLALSNLGKNGPARWIGGVVLVLFFFLICGGIATVPFLFLGGLSLQTTDINALDPFWVYIGGSVEFPFIWLGLWLVLRFIHQRPFRTLITYLPKISWGRLGQGFLIWLVLGIVAQLVDFALHPENAQLTFDASKFLMFLPFVLILTPIQTSAEELLFRGYFLQGLGRLFKNPIVLCVVSGILFAPPHMLNPEVTSNPGAGVLLFLNYALIGAVFTLYTLRDNRLELSLGAHMANNLFAALAVNYKDSALTTPAIFTTPALDPLFGLVTTVIIAVAFYLIVFKFMDRKPA